ALIPPSFLPCFSLSLFLYLSLSLSLSLFLYLSLTPVHIWIYAPVLFNLPPFPTEQSAISRYPRVCVCVCVCVCVRACVRVCVCCNDGPQRHWRRGARQEGRVNCK